MPRKPPPKKQAPVLEPGKSIEERFVEEFLIDRDPTAAVIRAGVWRINAKTWVKKLMGDPTIQRMIQLKTDTAQLEAMITPQRILAGWIEIANDRTAPAAARNAALRELANIKKMYPDQQKEADKGRNVMFVPAEPALDDWEKAASASQARLKDEVRH